MTLVFDGAGVVLDAAFADAELAASAGGEWIGRRFVDTVTDEGRAKIEELIGDSRNARRPAGDRSTTGAPGGRLPVRYRAIRFGDDGRLLVVGRDLRPMAALQQRLVEAQQEMEREYTRIRNAEKRYRLLFSWPRKRS